MSDTNGAARAGHNGLSEQGKAFVERIENLDRDIELQQAAAKELIDPIKADIKSVLEEAERAGLTKKSIKAVVKARKLARKAEAARANLDIADRDTFDNIRLALGDLAELPLGKAAIDEVGAARAKKQAPAAQA